MVYNPFNSILGVIIGVFMILAWLPTIFLTEINNKGNRIELDKLKAFLDTDDFKVTPGTLTGTTINSITWDKDYTNAGIISNTPPPNSVLDTEYIYIYYTGIKTTTTTVTENGKQETKTTTDFLTDGHTNSNVTFDGTTIASTDLNYLAKLKYIDIKDINVSDTVKITVSFYGILNNAKVCKVEGLDSHKDDFDIDIFNYEYGENKEDARNAIINRKDANNIVWKWIGRIGTFILLFIGLIALISPVRDAINAGATIPGIGFLMTPFKWIIGLYDVASLLIAIILTILMTMFVYALVNYPIISMLLGGIIIGLRLYLNKH